MPAPAHVKQSGAHIPGTRCERATDRTQRRDVAESPQIFSGVIELRGVDLLWRVLSLPGDGAANGFLARNGLDVPELTTNPGRVRRPVLGGVAGRLQVRGAASSGITLISPSQPATAATVSVHSCSERASGSATLYTRPAACADVAASATAAATFST
jgi:hypothetical protein